MNWLIHEARILTPEGEIRGDAWIKEGRWAAIGHIPPHAKGFSFPANGAYLLPGLIDTHVHFREPGLTAKGNFYTESRAAIAGGVTTVFDMPNTLPPTTTLEAWTSKRALVRGKSWTNFALYFGATADNLPAIRQLSPKEVPGVKIFLASSTGELLLNDEPCVRALMRHSPVRLLFHSEKEERIQAARQQWEQATWAEVPDLHTRARPPEACIESTRWLLAEAVHATVPIHILHITTAEEVALLRHRPAHLSAETCPVYLQWSAEDFPRYQNLLKCNPSLKYASDKAALWQGLMEGTLTVVGTDHAPHLLTEKTLPYPQAPSGVPSHGYVLPWLWTLGQAFQLPLAFWIEKMVYAPARLWQIQERGPIQEGFWADAVLFDPDGTTTLPPLEAPTYPTKCRWSPLAGSSLRGRVIAVWVNGTLSYANGLFIGRPAGQEVRFAFP